MNYLSIDINSNIILKTNHILILLDT